MYCKKCEKARLEWLVKKHDKNWSQGKIAREKNGWGKEWGMFVLQIPQDFKWNQNSQVGMKGNENAPRGVKCILFPCAQLWISIQWYLLIKEGKKKSIESLRMFTSWPSWGTGGGWWLMWRDSPIQQRPGCAACAGTRPAAELAGVSHWAGLRLRWSFDTLARYLSLSL